MSAKFNYRSINKEEFFWGNWNKWREKRDSPFINGKKNKIKIIYEGIR